MTFDLSSLNAEQREAVTATDGPVLVLAGAGSGKTRVITTRIAHLIRTLGVPPESVLAVTFTNKAAREMRARVSRLLKSGKQSPQPLLCTFHAFGVRFLRAHIAELGYRPDFVIFDSQDQQSVVKGLMEEGDYELGTLTAKEVNFSLQNAKGRGVTPEELLTHSQTPLDLQLGRLLRVYNRTMKRFNALDFEDLLLLSLRLCREHGEAAQEFFSAFRYVMVDEYQDTNRGQFDLLRAITAGHGNLCVVGDDDQSIYRWRGAEPGNILDFERDFPGARVVRLEQNYRSTGTILAAANQVIRNNTERKEKTLRTTQGMGKALEWLEGESEFEELEKVVTHLKLTRMREGGKYSDFAILYRANFQSRAVEEMLREEDIPYRLVGGTRFYERREVKDALAYLRLIVNPGDEVSLLRVLNFPRRGIGRTTQGRLMEMAGRVGRQAFDLCREATLHKAFEGAAGTALERFAGIIDSYRERFAAEPMGRVFRELLAEVGFHRAVEKERGDRASGERAVALIYELERAVDLYAEHRPEAGIKKYLEHVTLLTLPEEEEDGDRNPMVSLMTVHGAKGLEFPHVYLVQVAEEIFPNKRSLAEEGPEEERRLFYVAITRAKKQLVFSCAKFRKRFGEVIKQQPSRFLMEIEATLFDGAAPSSGGKDGKQLRQEKAAAAKGRFFDQMRKMRATAEGG